MNIVLIVLYIQQLGITLCVHQEDPEPGYTESPHRMMLNLRVPRFS
jgi:hypothetical protein